MGSGLCWFLCACLNSVFVLLLPHVGLPCTRLCFVYPEWLCFMPCGREPQWSPPPHLPAIEGSWPLPGAGPRAQGLGPGRGQEESHCCLLPGSVPHRPPLAVSIKRISGCRRVGSLSCEPSYPPLTTHTHIAGPQDTAFSAALRLSLLLRGRSL